MSITLSQSAVPTEEVDRSDIAANSLHLLKQRKYNRVYDVIPVLCRPGTIASLSIR